WMEKNFVPAYADEMAETAYVCGNPFSKDALDAEEFLALDEVWQYVWEEPGTVPPRGITDRTIEAFHEHQPDRLIAHYMQPHCPFLSSPDLTRGKRLDRFGDQEWDDVWQKLRAGELTRETVWAGYRENLELALDEVELLLENVDAERAVITSDHGNALGEWVVYGHPPTMPLDCLRVVPWVETTAVDRGTHDPTTEVRTDEQTDREEQLAALGYV
ncbi:MAG: hydrolase, partial [Haloplanus sp.]